MIESAAPVGRSAEVCGGGL